MGDTVIKAFRDLTIWIGSLTVLPGEHGPSSTLKVGLQRLKHGKLYKAEDDYESPEGASEQRLLDRLAEHVEGEELERAEEVRLSASRLLTSRCVAAFQNGAIRSNQYPVSHLWTMFANSAL